MIGWYAVQRGITSHHLFKGKPERLAVWMWLMDNAAWKDTTHDVKGITVSIPRGSVCASSRHIAERVGVGHQVARTALKRFEIELMINTEVTHGKSIVSLCNYEKYQDPNFIANTAPNTSLTQDQHKPNTQKEQGNKETRKQEKEDTDVSFSRSASFRESEFIDFWDAFPHRDGKKTKRPAAVAAFKKAIKNGVTVQQIAARKIIRPIQA
jgi:hypothetical protein